MTIDIVHVLSLVLPDRVALAAGGEGAHGRHAGGVTGARGFRGGRAGLVAGATRLSAAGRWALEVDLNGETVSLPFESASATR